MLSICRLAAGQENYYLDAVAKGREDYYIRGELPGRWAASSTALLGLDGTVSPDDLRHVLADRDPRTGARLGAAANRKIPGFDLTFRAPKSVSVLYGLADPSVAGVVAAAHEDAVDAAFDYLERHAVWSRRGHNGVIQVRADGLIAAAFRHRTSRNGDPHLHTHVLVANSVRGADGAWRTIDGRHLWAHAKTAGYLYEAHLRHELTQRLGVAWGPCATASPTSRASHSTSSRHFRPDVARSNSAWRARHEASPQAAMIAALDTRRPKKAPEEWSCFDRAGVSAPSSSAFTPTVSCRSPTSTKLPEQLPRCSRGRSPISSPHQVTGNGVAAQPSRADRTSIDLRPPRT